MRSYEAPPIAHYVNWRGRTVRRVREEAKLHDALDGYLQIHAPAFADLSAREIHQKLRQFAEAEQSAGRLKLTPEEPTPIGWSIKNAFHLIGMPLLFLLALPLLVIVAPFYFFQLRRLEKTDPELCSRVDQTYSDGLAQAEDHLVTNQFTAMGTLKPGLVRLATTIGILWTVNWGARHIFTRGRLARIARFTSRVGSFSTTGNGWSSSAITMGRSKVTWTTSSTRPASVSTRSSAMGSVIRGRIGLSSMAARTNGNTRIFSAATPCPPRSGTRPIPV
jgi:hypothetical protein